MRRFFYLVMLFPLLWVNPVRADDIEAYLYGADTESVFVQVLVDLGDRDVDRPLCIFGQDCGPPFMTAAAVRHLGAMYLEGEPVTAPGIFKAVLSAVLENPLLDGMYFSLLVSNHHDNPPDSSSLRLGGGTILQGYRQLRANRGDFIATLKAAPILAAELSHQLQPQETYFEWLRYLAGGDVALGMNTSGNFGQSNPQPDYDGDIVENGGYLTPFIGSSGCPKLYSILFTLGTVNSDSDLDAEIAEQLPGLGQRGFTRFLSYLHESSTDLLPQTDAIVPMLKTWVVSSRGQTGDALAYAVAGGGAPLLFVNDPVQLQTRLTTELLALVPVAGHSLETAFSKGTFSPGQMQDSVFVAQFLPQSNADWPGNLKKLKLEISAEEDSEDGVSTFDQLVDVRDLPAYEVSGVNKGKLRLDALTFWTDTATLSHDNGDAIPDDADGPVVARGGAGQKIDGFVSYSIAPGEFVQHFIGDTNTDAPINEYGPRQLFYAPSSGHELLPFDANSLTVEALSPLLDPSQTLTDEQGLNLIKWARGQDTDSESVVARSWIMGEVMHSRPFALNYGATSGYSEDNPNVRVLFGSGDGVFHIVQSTDTSGRESGREVFGFIPQESLATIRWRYDNQGEGLTRYYPGHYLRHYGVDGAPVVLRVDHNSDGTLDSAAGDEAYVYFGLRRGGSSYFALDISNPDALPTMAWKITRTVGGDFDELGLTFSTPVVGKVNYSGRAVDVLIFGGGYDGGWNEIYTARRGKDLAATDDTVGNAIYIVNARTGELIWKAVNGDTGVSTRTRYLHAGLVDSIPSTVSALLTPEGIVHRLYVGDSGGAVWRVDLPPNLDGQTGHRRDHWFITKLADIGFDAAETGGSASDDRRFFHAPDVVQSYDGAGVFDGVLVQSGNRADPNETLVENGLFYIKDREVVSGSAVVQAENDVSHPPGRYQLGDLPDQTICTEGSEEVVVGEEILNCGSRSIQSGWQIRFGQAGEKGLSTPLTDGGRVFASTFIPGAVTSCSRRQGRGRLYVLQLRDATATANNQRYYELGDGIPAAAMPVADAIFLPGGGIDLYDLDRDGDRDTTQLLPSQAGKLYRTYWREPGIDPL